MTERLVLNLEGMRSFICFFWTVMLFRRFFKKRLLVANHILIL